LVKSSPGVYLRALAFGALFVVMEHSGRRFVLENPNLFLSFMGLSSVIWSREREKKKMENLSQFMSLPRVCREVR
jgi:hypothetical protein